MKLEISSQLQSSFESAVNETDGVEYWFARDLQELLGYTKWENFIKVIDKGKAACTNAKQVTTDHFLDVRKMVDVGSVTPFQVRGSKQNLYNFNLCNFSIIKKSWPLRVELQMQKPQSAGYCA